MINLNDDEEKQVLGEILSDKLQAILEYVEDIPLIKKDVTKLKEDMTEVKSDIKVIKAVLKNHDTIITNLEAVR
jgi:hypothetical protein